MQAPAPASAPVLFRELAAANGCRLGVASLNAPATLNALSRDMADLLAARLAAWAADPAIALVVLEAEGDRAFCAGGDLHGLYKAMRAHAGQGGIPAGVSDFFEREYHLDYLLRTYSKPILGWGHGIVMGGGMGLLQGASHRVVTEASRLAMPEIVIGLFPDVGMSWSLNRMPGKTGRFLALTGASLQASDALFAGWADYRIEQGRKPAVLDALQAQSWTGRRASDDLLLHQVLDAQRAAPDAAGPLRRHLDTIDELCRGRDLHGVMAGLAGWGSDDPWVRTALANLANGAPSTARLAWELQERTRYLSLADIFRLEYRVAVWCCVAGDFQEGIRALLIDKDRRPAWSQGQGDVGPEWTRHTWDAIAAIPGAPMLERL